MARMPISLFFRFIIIAEIILEAYGVVITVGSVKKPMYFQKHGRCYYSDLHKPVSRSEARLKCQENGYDLISIETLTESEYITTFLQEVLPAPVDENTPYHKFWTSGTRGESNIFIWPLTGEEDVVGNWAEASIQHGDYIILSRQHNFKWMSVGDFTPAFPLCERTGCRRGCVNGGVCKCDGKCVCPANYAEPTCANKKACSLTCNQSGSIASTDCRSCLCPNLVMEGPRVIDENGQSVFGVSIVLSPYTVLNVSDTEGKFTVTGQCYGTKVILYKSGYDSRMITLAKELPQNITLLKEGELIKGPTETIATRNQLVRFCCLTRGTIYKVTWLFNGGRKGLSGFLTKPNKNKYVINIIRATSETAGRYQCVAYTKTRRIVSQPALLRIVDGDSGCSKPTLHFAPLPDACARTGNLAVYNKKTCDNLICASESCLKSSAIAKCCIAKSYEHNDITCPSFTFPAISIKQCQCSSCDENAGTLVVVRGFVTEFNSKDAIEHAVVSVENEKILSYSDKDGEFVLYFRVLHLRRYILIVKGSNQTSSFVPHVEVLEISRDSAPSEIILHIRLHIAHMQTFEVPTYYIPFMNEDPIVKFNLLSSSNETGTLSTAIFLLDARIESHILRAPADFLTLVNGQEVVLNTQAMFFIKNIEIKAEELNMIVVYMNDKYVERYGRTGIKNRLYSLDLKTGYWSIIKPSGKIGKKQNTLEYVGSLVLSNDHGWFAIGWPQTSTFCFAKVRSFQSEPARKETQNLGARVEVLTSVTVNNAYSFYSLSRSVFTNKAGTTCIALSCSGYIKYIRVKTKNGLASVEDLTSNIPKSEISRLGVKKSTNFFKTSKINGKISRTGPFSYKTRLTCAKSSYNSGFFAFITGIIYPIQLNVRTTAKAMDKDRNHLAWYASKPYKSCYLRVKYIRMPVPPYTKRSQLPEMIFSARSVGGTHSLLEKKFLGIRKDRSTKGVSCLEYKCSGQFDMADKSKVDNTHVQIQIEDKFHSCTVISMSPKIKISEREIVPRVTVAPWRRASKLNVYMNHMKSEGFLGVFIGTSSKSHINAEYIARKKCLMSTERHYFALFGCLPVI